MNAAAATTSDRAAQPPSSRAWARASATLNAFAGLVALVFTLIRYGKTHAVTIRAHIAELGRGLAGRFFGTAAILAGTHPNFANTAEYAAASRDVLLVPIDRPGSLTQFIAEVDRRKAPASRVETPRFEAPPEHQRPDSLSAEEQSSDRAPPHAASAECSSPQAGPCPASGETFERIETAPAMQWPVSSPPAREVAAAALP